MAYGVGYQGIGIYPMGPAGPKIDFPHMKRGDNDHETTRRRPRSAEPTETWTPSPPTQREQLELQLLRHMRDPNFHDRLSDLAQESDAQWQRVGNPDTWKQAGVSQQDMLGISERALAETDQRVANGMERGEAAYLAQAGELSRWAGEHLNGAPPERLGALQDMHQGGQAYVQVREEFLQLRQDSGLAGLSALD